MKFLAIISFVSMSLCAMDSQNYDIDIEDIVVPQRHKPPKSPLTDEKDSALYGTWQHNTFAQLTRGTEGYRDALDKLVMEGALDDFKKEIQLDNLDLSILEQLRYIINMRKRALEIADEIHQSGVRMQLDHINGVLKRLAKIDDAPGTESTSSKYLKTEKEKLANLQQLVNDEVSRQTQWFITKREPQATR